MVLYSLEILNELCEKHNITLNKDYSDEKINVNTHIIGNCITEECPFTFDKRFESFKINPGLCKKCVSKKAIEKAKQTSIIKYGVDNISKLDETKELIKKINIERYGVACAINNHQIKEKRKQTNLKKYGKEHVFNTEFFINKKKKTCLDKYGYESASQSYDIKEKVKQTSLERYGVICSLLNDEVKEKTKLTILDKYGVEHISQSEEIKEQIKKTNLEKYGVICPLQSEDIKEYTKQFNLDRYGVEYSSQSKKIKDKIKKTNLERYGNTCVLLSPIIKEKTKNTNLLKYGVENVSQNKDIAYKASISMFRKKEYILPSGAIIIYQGYENFALDEIICEMKIDENDIIMGVNNVPEIWYKYNDKEHRHYVDIYIPSLNMCIEVKSTWTIDKKREQVFLKMERAKELGYIYEIWVYKENGTKVECYK